LRRFGSRQEDGIAALRIADAFECFAQSPGEGQGGRFGGFGQRHWQQSHAELLRKEWRRARHVTVQLNGSSMVFRSAMD
jgi:hypothetical protein